VPSLGSTFKRPAKDISAAKLIDDCGFRGYRIGNAKISEKHAGFIVNCGGATASDYLTLADFVSNGVAKKFGINLEKEVEIL
jgi:UDP-N-acetylmuramate dehydrogenase